MQKCTVCPVLTVLGLIRETVSSREYASCQGIVGVKCHIQVAQRRKQLSLNLKQKSGARVIQDLQLCRAQSLSIVLACNFFLFVLWLTLLPVCADRTPVSYSSPKYNVATIAYCGAFLFLSLALTLHSVLFLRPKQPTARR